MDSEGFDCWELDGITGEIMYILSQVGEAHDSRSFRIDTFPWWIVRRTVG